jgi:undecaprenyl diphosphate synthase
MLAGSGPQVSNPPRLSVVPRHVAIIMDGNGRWARKRGLPRLAGHRAGTENTRRIIESCVELDVPVLTLYAFSTENWGRPREEVDGLFAILADVIDRETEALHEQGVQLRHIGKLEGLPPTLRERVSCAVELTKANRRLVLNVAFNYGGRAEILQAVQRLLADGVAAEALTEDLFASYLHTAGVPDPDLIIRTAGEMRLSNFLLWQAAYAEYYCTETHWPDFGKEEFYRALCEFGQRQRRFGRV